MRLAPLVAAAGASSASQCVLRGNCGPASRFGADLPCVNYTEPEPLLDNRAVNLLTDICGAELASAAVCCDAGQVQDLAASLKRVEPLIGSCGACKQNFYDVFCRFTCSPHQADWLEVVETQSTLSGGTAPKEVNYYVDELLAARFYDSCSNVKFSATNSRAMDLVGGGAKNHEEFLKFLGDEKPMLGGSAFQITFPWDKSDHRRQNESAGYDCGSGPLKCSCIDCEDACPPASDDLDRSGRCTLGPFRCVSLVLLLSYALFVVGLGLLYIQARKSQRRRSSLEIQRLIQDDNSDEHFEDDPFALPSSELGTLNLRTYRLNSWIESWLKRQALFCARYPSLVIALCALFVLCCSLGLVGMQLETDPVSLWVAPNSREAAERSFFNAEFGGFYRTAQLFVVNETGGPVLGDDYDVLSWLKSVERRVAEIQTPVLWDSLESFCLKPVGDNCVVESVTQYGVGDTPTWRQRLERCTKQPVNCLPKFQQPIDPHLVFGVPATSNSSELSSALFAASLSEAEVKSASYLDAPALVTTWVLQNSEDPVYLHRVVEWENLVEDFLHKTVDHEAASRGLRVSFNVESSLERELSKSGQTDVKIIVLSYVLMFAYVSLSLGDSAWLGITGILVVLCSVSSAVGLLSMLGFKLTLIITEVIPFLALAIGVDNIFLLVHQVGLVSEVSPGLFTVEDQIATAVASIGPSIVLSTSCEAAALAIAALVPMPAVRNFAVFACGAVLINSALQLTLFISMLTLHIHRRVPAQPATANVNNASAYSGVADTGAGGSNAVSPARSPTSRGSDELRNQVDKRRFSFIISTEYTPFLLGKHVKQVVGCLFLLWLAFSFYVLPQIDLGLDQRLAVPRDSFLVSYYSDVSEYLGVGPPVYFVVVSDDVEDPEAAAVERRPVQQKLCGRFSTCDTESLVNVLETERKRPDVSWLATAPASWIDDFLMWLNPSLDTCCIEEDSNEVCYAHKQWSFDMTGFPEGANFTRYLEKWLDQPSDQCPLAGKAPYGQALSLEGGRTGSDLGGGIVRASYFRTNHVPLRSQSDYIHAYAASRRIADRISSTLDLRVFPYSIFYPFFAQYTTIVSDTVYLVGSAIAVTWLISAILLGNLRTATIVSGVVLSLLINVAGLMYLSGVNLNGLSLVNLVICVGLGVEFCIHIARSFTFVPRVRAIGIRGFSRVDRAYNALAGTGGTVFGGVALTKLLGVCVLAFANSKIFNVYYFRMWLALIVSATLHSLMLLPVLLSVWGGSAWLVEGESSAFADLEEL